MRAMDWLVENELIRNIGVSNFLPEHLEQAMAATKYKIVNNQIHYSLSARAHERNGTLDFCRRHQILITAYEPLKKGALVKQGEVPVVDEICEKYQKTPAQVALRWLVQKPGVVTIFKTRNKEHLAENLGALGWEMSAEDQRKLDQSFPEKETMLP